jgi:hypothetical protein
MKKAHLILVTIFQIIVTFSYAQTPELVLRPTEQSVNIRGGAIKKGDTVALTLAYKNNNSNARSFYLDFQHQITAINLIDIVFPTAGATGSALPTGATATFQNQYYPGYTFVKNANNTTTDGITNFNYAQYNYTQGGSQAINRIWVNTASQSNLVDGDLAYLRFKVENISAGFSYDSVYFNAAQCYGTNYNGYTSVYMPKPRNSYITPIPSSNALINGKVDVSSIVPKIMIVDTTTHVVKATVIPANDGTFYLGSELSPNTWYYAYATIPSDSIPSYLNRAVTVSDYTAAQNEFIRQNLDKTYTNVTMKSGASWIASDITMNKVFDGNDLTALFAQVTGADTVVTAMSGQTLYNIPMLEANVYDTLTPAYWKDANLYGVLFKTTTQTQDLKLKYLIPGDINRSHSSQVVKPDGTIQSFGTKSAAVNTPNPITSIDVSLKNITVTENQFTVPITIDANGAKLSGMQFEFVYDPTKVKFESVTADVPTWLVFATSGPGRVKFGAVDKDVKNAYIGGVPFKILFSTLQNGLDINSYIKVTSNMDASDMSGNQLAINLNTTTIKLTGYNNF